MAPTLRVVPGASRARRGRPAADFLDRLKEIAPPETWRPVVGYEGRYEVSDRGRVRSLSRHGVRRTRLLHQHKNDRGYLRVFLAADGGRKFARVHLLVAAAFIGPCPPGYTVDHLDRDKRNNRPGNFEYVTRLENYRRHLKRAREALEDVLEMFAPPTRQAAAS